MPFFCCCFNCSIENLRRSLTLKLFLSVVQMKCHEFDHGLVFMNYTFFLQTRNTKKAEDNVSSLEKEIDENSNNLQRLDVSNDSINDSISGINKHKTCFSNP